ETEQLLELLFLQHAEALFLVDDHEAEILELDVLRDQAMCADDNVDLTRAKSVNRLPLLARRTVAAEEFNGDRVVAHPLAQSAIVLLGENSCENKESDLFPAHDRLERRADGDFRFAKAHVSADETIHRLIVFHVGFHRLDRGQLIRCLLVDEGGLELVLPLVVLGECESCEGFAFGVNSQQLRGVVEDGFLRVLLRPRPFSVAQSGELRVFLPDADITRDEIALLQRDIEPGLCRELEHEHFVHRIAERPALHPSIPGNSMCEMDAESTIAESAKIDLRTAMDFASAPQREPACTS